MLLKFCPGTDIFLFFLGGGPPIFFGPNLLVKVKLDYTPNFAALGHVEVSALKVPGVMVGQRPSENKSQYNTCVFKINLPRARELVHIRVIRNLLTI